MFNFQKEVVLNNLNKAAVVEPQEAGLGKPAIDKKLRFHDGGEYFAKYIVDKAVYKTEAVPGENFKLTIDASSLTDKHVQILVELGLDNDYRGDYGSALWYFRKPLLVDVVLPKSSTEAAKVLTAAFAAAVPAEYKFVVVDEYKSGSSVVINGADSYQKVRKVSVVEFVCDERCAGNGSEEPETVLELSGAELVASESVVTYEPNKAEFGTYEYLLHNLRLPTYENYRFTSPSAVEMPISGATYTQYTFAYCVPRVGLGGMSAAGQTIHSTTLHTFYVNDAVVSDFEDMLKELDEELEPQVIVPKSAHEVKILPDKYAATADLKGKKAVAAVEDVYTKE